ncbi:MAG: DUF948 domain-containing protein [Microbacteriaceae bacterium]|nr:DUF948 domain-containing protein [Microbacteriaceae bacterium]
MSIGDIAALIAAIAFAVLSLAATIPLIKLGRTVDEVSDSIKSMTDGIEPVLSGLAETVTETNKQLAKIDKITTSVEEVTLNIASLSAVFAKAVGGPLMKLAGLGVSLSKLLKGKK